MHGCAWLLLYALLLSCADACGLKVGMSPGPAFGRNTSQTIFPTGWPQGSDPGLTNALTAKPKEPCSETGFTKHHCVFGLSFRRSSARRHCITDYARCKVPFPQQMAQAK